MYVYVYNADTYANKFFVAIQICPNMYRFIEYKYALLYKWVYIQKHQIVFISVGFLKASQVFFFSCPTLTLLMLFC